MSDKVSVDDLVAEFKIKKVLVDVWERKHPGLDQIPSELKNEYERIKEFREYLDRFEAYYEAGDPILDTGLRWGVPYLFDVKKYRGVVNNPRLISDKSQSMSLTGSVYGTYDTTLSYCLGLWSHVGCQGVDTGSHDDFVFYEGDDDDNTKEFEERVRAVAACVIGIDREAVERIITWREEQIASLREEINGFEAILNENDEKKRT